MMQVIRVCDDDDGGVGRVSTQIFAQCACANKCTDAWSMAAYASVPGCSQHVISFFIRVCVHAVDVRGHAAPHLKVSVVWCCGWFWGQQMYSSTVPEGSKLPVIFPMMQRSVHNHTESILLRCSLSASPAHRLTGCHNNPRSRSMLIRTKQWEAQHHRNTTCHNTFPKNLPDA